MYMKKIFLILALVVVLFFTTNQVSAVTLSCTDSDGGKIYSTQGNLSYAGKSYTDYCYTTNTNYVIEYYCNESGVGKAEYYLCNIGCENGACNSTTCTPNYNNCGSWSACTNGSKIQTCSQTNCPSLPSTKTNTESCTATCTPNYNNCGSWSACTNGSKTQTCSQTNCPTLPLTQTNTESCTTPTSCTDSDSGLNYFTQGTSAGINGYTYTDTCSATNRLLEYYCLAGQNIVQTEEKFCDNGCQNGACVAIFDECYDSDGKNYFTKEFLTYRGESLIDSCYSSTGLNEYYCNTNYNYSGPRYSIENKTCDYGCTAGACKKGINFTSISNNFQMEIGKSYEVLWQQQGYENKDVSIDVYKFEVVNNQLVNPVKIKSIKTVYGAQANDAFSWTVDVPLLDNTHLYKFGVSELGNNNINEVYGYSGTFQVYNLLQTTHTECQNGACVSVSGAGTNQCTFGNDSTCSLSSTHTECQNQQCVAVNGTGTNQCTLGTACGGGTVTCTDTDAKNFYTKGIVTYKGISYVDRCDTKYLSSGYDLIEYYCDSTGIGKAIYGSCSGGPCVDGACK